MKAGIRKFAATPTLFAQITQPEGEDYIIIPGVSSERRRYVPMGFMSSNTKVTDLVQIVPNATLFEFGVLTSNVHMAWTRVVCSRMKSDYRYLKDIVYNNFPWCSATDEQLRKTEQTAQGILDALTRASESLVLGNREDAEQILQDNYPFEPVQKDGRKYTTLQMVEQFYRDGFIDRYSGEKLVNPGMLRVMSEKIPEIFPFQAHWKTDECHMAYWDYQPTVDHIYPIALGGKDEPTNWASTSMVNNSAKSNFTLEQLKWTLKPVGNIELWDGLSKQFIDIVENDTSLLKNLKIKDWYKATIKVQADYLKSKKC